MSNKQVLLKRSNALNPESGLPKAPDVNSMEYGELALNFNAGNEALFTRNSKDEIVNLLANDKTVAALTDAITQHINDHSNPHHVTKIDVGLNMVDNTSDLDKPISKATQTALDEKLNTSTDIVDNLTTNSTVKTLSANMGIVLEKMIKDAQAGSSEDTQKVQEQLNAISTRLDGAVEEIDGAVELEDAIIAKEDTMIDNYLE